MKRLPIEKRIGKCDHVFVKSNEIVAMYEVVVETEIVGYNICLIAPTSRALFVAHENEIHTRSQADEHFDRLTIRVEMKRRGICLN